MKLLWFNVYKLHNIYTHSQQYDETCSFFYKKIILPNNDVSLRLSTFYYYYYYYNILRGKGQKNEKSNCTIKIVEMYVYRCVCTVQKRRKRRNRPCYYRWGGLRDL